MVAHYTQWADKRLADAYDLIDAVIRDYKTADEIIDLLDAQKAIEQGDETLKRFLSEERRIAAEDFRADCAREERMLKGL